MSEASRASSWVRSRSGAIAIGLFFLTVVAFLRSPLLPDIGRELELSAFGLGALGSVFALGRVAVDVPAGRMTDRHSPGPMMAFAAVNVALGAAGLALAPNSTVAFAAVFVLGVGSAWTLTTAMAHFAAASSARRGVALSVFAAALLIGQAIGPAVGGWLGAAYDWRVALGVGAGVAVVVGVPFLLHRSDQADRAIDSTSSGTMDTPPEVSRLVFPVLYLLPAVQFSVGAAMVHTLVPLVADERYALGSALVGGALAVAGGSRFVAAVISGVVIDRISRRSVLIPGVLVQALGVAVFAFGDSLMWWWMSIVLVSLGSIGVSTGSVVIADLSGGEGFGRRLGAFRLTGDSALVVAPLLTGWLFDEYGRAVSMLPLLAFAVAVAIVAIVVVPETHPRVYHRSQSPIEPGNTE